MGSLRNLPKPKTLQPEKTCTTAPNLGHRPLGTHPSEYPVVKNWASATRNPGASSSSRRQSPTKAWPRYSSQSPTAILHQVRTIQPQSPVDPATAFQPVPTAIFLQSMLQISAAKLLQSMLQLLAVKLLQSVLPATKLLQNPTEISNNPSRLRTAQPRLVRPSFSNLARPSYCPTLPDCPAI